MRSKGFIVDPGDYDRGSRLTDVFRCSFASSLKSEAADGLLSEMIKSAIPAVFSCCDKDSRRSRV